MSNFLGAFVEKKVVACLLRLAVLENQWITANKMRAKTCPRDKQIYGYDDSTEHEVIVTKIKQTIAYLRFATLDYVAFVQDDVIPKNRPTIRKRDPTKRDEMKRSTKTGYIWVRTVSGNRETKSFLKAAF